MSPLLQEILKQAEQLTSEERLELVQKVLAGLDQLESIDQIKPAKHRVSEFCGIAPHLLGGQDAQEWVNELRDEWSEREAQWS